MKKISAEQYEFLNGERKKLDTLVKSKYLRDLNQVWYTKAREIYTKITGRIPGTCTGCTITVLATLHKALLNYEKELHPIPKVENPPINIEELLTSMTPGECDDCDQSFIKEELKSEDDAQKEEGAIASKEGISSNNNEREFNKTPNRRANHRQRRG